MKSIPCSTLFIPGLFGLIVGVYSSSAPADETLRTRIQVGKWSFQCTDLADFKTTQCDLFISGSDPVRKELPVLSEVANIAAYARVGSPLVKVVEGLISQANASGGSLPAQIETISGTDKYGVPTIDVEVRFAPVPRLVFVGRLYNRPPPPPTQPCTGDCCNAWCGTGQF
jgi:hypothetical protein